MTIFKLLTMLPLSKALGSCIARNNRMEDIKDTWANAWSIGTVDETGE